MQKTDILSFDARACKGNVDWYSMPSLNDKRDTLSDKPQKAFLLNKPVVFAASDHSRSVSTINVTAVQWTLIRNKRLGADPTWSPCPCRASWQFFPSVLEILFPVVLQRRSREKKIQTKTDRFNTLTLFFDFGKVSSHKTSKIYRHDQVQKKKKS